MNKSQYRAYLKSAHWIAFRALILKTRRRCESCTISELMCRFLYGNSLDLHHLTYQRLGKEKPSDVQVLCRACHEVEEQFKQEQKGNFDARLFQGLAEFYGDCPVCKYLLRIGPPCTPKDRKTGKYKILPPQVLEGCDCEDIWEKDLEEFVKRYWNQFREAQR